MAFFQFDFQDTVTQEVTTQIEANTKEEAEVLFEAGEWTANIKSEVISHRDFMIITEVDDD